MNIVTFLVQAVDQDLNIYKKYLKMGNNCGTNDVETHNPHVLAGNQHFKKEEYAQAVDEYTLAIKDDPKDIGAYNSRALCYKKLNRPEEALQDLNQVIKLHPIDPQAYTHRAQAHIALNQSDGAYSDLETAINIDTHYSPAYFKLGQLQEYSGHYQKAIEYYTTGLGYDDKNIDGYLSRGMCYHRIKKNQECVHDFNKVFELDNNKPQAFFYRGLAHSAMDKHNEAVSDFTQYLKTSPKNSQQTLYERSKSYLQLKKYLQAQHDLANALSHQPNHPIYMLQLANCHLKQNREEEALTTMMDGINSYQQQHSYLVSKYKMDQRSIIALNRHLKKYGDYIIDIEKIQNLAEANKNHQFVDQAIHLKKQLQKIYIPILVQRDPNIQQNLAIFQSSLLDLHNRNQASINTQLKIIMRQIQSIPTKKIFDDGQLQLIIDNISQSDVRDYFKILHPLVLNHLVTYHVLYHAYFNKNTESFEETAAILAQLSCYQPITKQLISFEQLVKSPFYIIQRNTKQKMSIMVKSISSKIGTSSLIDYQSLTNLTNSLISQLSSNKQFIAALTTGLRTDKQAYLTSTWQKIAQGHQGLTANDFVGQGVKFNSLQRVIVAHMILITKMMYEIDLKDFHKCLENCIEFNKIVIKCLPPWLNTMKQQGLTDGNFKELGSNDHGCCQSGCSIM